MPLWQRMLITLVTMLLTSLVVGLLWRWLFNTDIPSYLSGSRRRRYRGAGLGAPEKNRNPVTVCTVTAFPTAGNS